MKKNGMAGKQLDSKILYQRQKELRESGAVTPGPVVVAAGLTMPENIGLVLRPADAAGVSRVVLVNKEMPNLARVRKTARSADAWVKWEIIDDECHSRPGGCAVRVAAAAPSPARAESNSRYPGGTVIKKRSSKNRLGGSFDSAYVRVSG